MLEQVELDAVVIATPSHLHAAWCEGHWTRGCMSSARSRSASTTATAPSSRHSARYDAEPGFITMNLPALLDVLVEAHIDNPVVCSNINKIGFWMSLGFDQYERALRDRRLRAVAMWVYASGAIPPKEALEWVRAQPNIESIVFGASSRQHIASTKSFVDEMWGPKSGPAVAAER